ncbi:MAG: hypothetical protein AAGG75_25410 [Bacteroidota bacterium]
MKTRLLLSALCLLLCAQACKKDRNEKKELEEITETPNPNNQGNNMEDLKVPDGFNYSYSKKVNLDLKFFSKSKEPVSNVRYTLYGMDAEGNTEVLFNGGTGTGDQMQLLLDVPNHFEKIIIKTTYKNTVRQFEFLTDEVISRELPVEGLSTVEVSGRASDCYPSLVTNFTADNKGFTINSDQLMHTIEVLYSDGSSEVITVNATTFSY